MGEGILKGHSQPRTCSRKRILKSNWMKGSLDDIVYIDVDVDIDGSHNVIIIDDTESGPEKFQGSCDHRQNRKVPPIICVDDDDDDDDDDEDDEVGYSGIRFVDAEFDSDASSSRKSCTNSKFTQRNVDLDDDECQVVLENKCPFKLSKCRKKVSAREPAGKYSKLDNDCCGGSSEGDCSDCELIEDSSGKLHQRWEKASLKRKTNVHVDQASGSGSHVDVDVENRTEWHSEAPVHSISSNADYVKEDAYTSNDIGGATLNAGSESPFTEAHENVDQEDTGGGGTINYSGEEQMYQRYPFASPNHIQEDGNKDDLSKGPSTSDFNDAKFVIHGATINSLQSEEAGLAVGVSCGEKKDGAVSGEPLFSQSPTIDNPLGCNETTCSLEREKPNSAEISSLREARDNSDEQDVDAQNGSLAISEEGDIINERERLKETDEYRRAIEEEWASRQLQLQIQAEEAQRLRKRKKAESMRLLDMQRRQIQRVEEVRETQKKDEENMNLKEQIRLEIRTDLNKLETTCFNMASLLRGLGIQVGRDLFPSLQEVQVAYKKALLKFHPDRASRTDIRQQVEAEEIFKLISRMKDKFLL